MFAGSNSFTNQTVDLLVNNYNLTLECSATNYSDNYSVINYKWKKDKEIILSNDRYFITNSLLIIVNLTTADADLYHCIIYDSVEKQITINTIQVIIKGT